MYKTSSGKIGDRKDSLSVAPDFRGAVPTRSYLLYTFQCMVFTMNKYVRKWGNSIDRPKKSFHISEKSHYTRDNVKHIILVDSYKCYFHMKIVSLVQKNWWFVVPGGHIISWVQGTTKFVAERDNFTYARRSENFSSITLHPKDCVCVFFLI